MIELDEFDALVKVLSQGGSILYPTDTIWGLGADATDSKAVSQLYTIKRRDRSKPFVMLVSDIDMLKQYVTKIHPRLETLLHYHARPLTVIYENVVGLAANAISKDGTAAIRVTTDWFCQELINRFGKPIVATSANISNDPFPENFSSISTEVMEQVDFIVSYKREVKKMLNPSPIVRLGDKAELEFIRP